VEQLVPQDQ